MGCGTRSCHDGHGKRILLLYDRDVFEKIYLVFKMNYGKAFKEIREEQGLSRKEVANQIGCTPSALCKIENGKTVPKEKTIEAFCIIMRIPIARFYVLCFEPADYGSLDPMR